MQTLNYPNGQEILEPQANDIVFEFENEASLFSHVLEHVAASHKRERWDDLDLIPCNDLHRILIIANASYLFSPNLKIVYKNRNRYVFVSGYRFWHSKTQEERAKKFNRSQKELYALVFNHDREYQKVLDIQKQLPKKELELELDEIGE